MNAVIVDFDGTIADSFEHVLNFLLQQAGRTPESVAPEERQALKGLGMKDLALRVGIARWRLPFIYFRGKAQMKKHMESTLPFAGMPQVLAALHAADYKLFIISSNNRRNITRFLVEHGLSGYFLKVYGNAGWFRKGPVLIKALHKNGLQAETTVYVGDEVRDIIGAKVAGMPSVAVTWGFGSEEQLLAHGPTILVRHPAELQKALLAWDS